MASPKKKKRQSRVKFGKKLVGYAAAAGATLAMGPPAAEATVIDLPDIVLRGPNAATTIDMNGDSIPDFLFNVFTYAYGASSQTFSQGSYAGQIVSGNPSYSIYSNFVAGELKTAFSYSGSTSLYPYARNFGPGQLISAALFSTPAYDVGYSGPSYGTALGGPVGNFAGKRGFLGVTFQDAASNQYYGWIDIGATANLHQLTIYRWGYEEQPGVGVQTPVPEPGSLALLAMGAAGLAAWRRTRKKGKPGQAA